MGIKPLSLAAVLTLIPSLALAVCTLVWDPPTQDTAGDPLVAGDIWAYRIYIVNKSETFVKGSFDVEVASIDQGVSDPPSNIACSSTSVTPGKKVAVTAVGNFGNESDFSNVLTSVHPDRPVDFRTEDR